MRNEILSAISDELHKSSEFHVYVVDHVSHEGDLFCVRVNLGDSSSKGLDESFEGATAWWPGDKQNGAADVLSVLPERQQINLRFATCQPPTKGEKLWLYPPRYLEALQTIWTNLAHAQKAESWLNTMAARNEFDPGTVPRLGRFSNLLRSKQALAFDLMGYQSGFLWGPPGTGKTFTLGAMLAQHLLDFPKKRILVLSTTNTATDQALVSVDQAFERTDARSPLRKQCKRLGQHFLASNYKGREHLLPVIDEGLIRKLAVLESQKPLTSDVHAYSAWKHAQEALRKEIRRQSTQVLDSSRLVAMTATRAAFTYEEIVERSPFDLIVFDEASQVSLPHALALAPLGKRIVFAGDPQQLAPIVQSRKPNTVEWMGQSMFSCMDKSVASTCILVEQSRMAEPICEVVSKCFYDGKLMVADDVANDASWQRHRRLFPTKTLSSNAVTVEDLSFDGTWSQRYRGPIRFKSAERIAEIVSELCLSIDQSDILVLTPFRAQRTLIRSFVERLGHRNVLVSTVHKAQGSERHTVLFDPVDGDNVFLRTDDAKRLVNVALSRAKARLVVFLSPKDRRNPLFQQIATKINAMYGPSVASKPIQDFISAGLLITTALGETVEINGRVGKIVDVQLNGAKFRFEDANDGRVVLMVTDAVARATGASVTPPPVPQNPATNTATVRTPARNSNPSSIPRTATSTMPPPVPATETAQPVVRETVPVSKFVSEGNFPTNAIGQLVDINGRIGRVVDVLESGKKFRFRDRSTLKMVTMLTKVVVESAASKQ